MRNGTITCIKYLTNARMEYRGVFVNSHKFSEWFLNKWGQEVQTSGEKLQVETPNLRPITSGYSTSAMGDD